MDIELHIDSNLDSPKLVVYTPEITNDLKEMLDSISNISNKVISGFDGSKYEILDMSELVCVYANNAKVYAQSLSKTYLIKFRLYEMENILSKSTFVRISKSEIVNLKMVKNFDLSIVGTICVNLKNGKKTYVSRRYVPNVKEKLGI